MKIVVMSDSHDHLENVENAISQAGTLGTDVLLHCGDLCSPFVIDRLAGFPGQVHIVFGNNDGDRYTIARIAGKYSHLSIHGEFGVLDTEDGDIAFTHQPGFARGLASTGTYTAVFYGHTHIRKSERIKHTWLVNPGELMGLREAPGFLLFDLKKGSAEHFAV
ncbi:MAG: YfcE family phosphodiesterase [Candidatus Krumholzibacteriota bacterium]|nr:YfcE family phosphodiesterase [Candidatus Krumholzibacteriota bacterium]